MQIPRTQLSILIAVSFVASAFAQPYDPVVLWDRSGAGENSRYGGKIVALGDQNDDGFSDFAVWAFGGGSIGSIDEAKIEFFFGGNPPSLEPYLVFSGDVATGREIDYFADVGDINGDGFIDWQIWWWMPDEPENWQYSIYLGGPTPSQQPAFTLFGTTDEQVHSAGDFNGDGYDDLYRFYWPPLDLGQIYYGGDPMDTIPDWTRHSPTGHRYQTLPMTIGDLNGDGFSDFASDTPPPERMTYFFLGGANPDTIPAFTWEGFWTAPYEIVRDLNNDGKDDLIFAVSGGHMNVHLGRDVPSRESDFTLNFDPSCAPFRIVSAGDFNHDGYNDLVVVDDACNNRWGTLSLYLGYSWLNAEPVITIEGRTLPLNLIGINNATGLGDVNGDGVDDLAIGAFNTNFDGRRGRVVILSGDTSLQVGVDKFPPAVPQELAVNVYPNPFNSSATFSFALPLASPVTLSVFNTLGQRVREVNLGRMAAGEHRYLFEGGSLPSGVYLARVEAAGRMETRKLVLMR